MSEAAAIFAAAFRRLRPEDTPPPVEVQFRPYANVNSTIRLRGGRLLVRLSDLLEKAPPAVLTALALLLVSKLYRLPAPPGCGARFRRFLHRGDIVRQVRRVRRVRGRKNIGTPSGEIHHLDQVFHRLNEQYFGGLLPRPVLSWSRTRSRRMLGHFDPAHHTIIISRLFDSLEVPACALDLVMYHEMLHVKHPVEYCGGRRRVHSPQFQQDERRFEGYNEARLALKSLNIL